LKPKGRLFREVDGITKSGESNNIQDSAFEIRDKQMFRQLNRQQDSQ
jgi:hypothetical protein